MIITENKFQQEGDLQSSKKKGITSSEENGLVIIRKKHYFQIILDIGNIEIN